MCYLMESVLTAASGTPWSLLVVGVFAVVLCLWRVATSESSEAYFLAQGVVVVMGVFVMFILPLVNPDPYGCRIDPGICIGSYPRVDLHCYR